LYAGSGSIGLEALSRGATVTLVDNSPDSINLIKKNSAVLKESPKIIPADCERFVSNTGEKFDIIFLDPPYGACYAEYERILGKIFSSGVLREGGEAILEIARDKALPEGEGFEVKDVRNYGPNKFVFMRGISK
jgi:16S rRNA (guanine(966)-N(2))-methyltransferase RsmD